MFDNSPILLACPSVRCSAGTGRDASSHSARREIGGGLNFRRRHFLRILDAVVLGRVERLIVAHRDRLCRFGFEMVEHLCRTHDCDLVVMNQESLSPEQEMVQDMLSIVHCFSARLYGLRNYRKSLRQALANDTKSQDRP